MKTKASRPCRAWVCVVLGLVGCTPPRPVELRRTDLSEADRDAGARAEGMPAPSQMRDALAGLGLDLDRLPRLQDVPDDRVPALMQIVSTALGATCADCHVADTSVDTLNVRVARKMWDELVRKLTLADGQALFCDSCHAGRLTYLDRSSDAALSTWMNEAFVEGLRRKDGVPQDCTTCHGTPFDPGFLDAWGAVEAAAPRDASADDGTAGDLGVSGAPAPLCNLVLNEVQVAGYEGPDDEFIELFNPCADAISLVGLTLVYRSAAGTTETTLVRFTDGAVGPAGYLVVANLGYAGVASAWYATQLAAAGGGIALRAPDGHVLDAIAYGDATNLFVQGLPGKAPPSARSLSRVPDGSHAHANQSLDLVITAPTPGDANVQ